jgi:hypothetical protein
MHTEIWFNKMLATQSLLYGSESWKMRGTGYGRLMSAEMHMKETAGHTLSDSKKNEEILRQL